MKLSLQCAIVGQTRSSFHVEIDDGEKVSKLKEMIQAKKPLTITCEADQLQLFLATKDSGWLLSDSDDVKALKKGGKTDYIDALMDEDLELQGEFGLKKVLAGILEPSTEEIHVLVVVPGITTTIEVDEIQDKDRKDELEYYQRLGQEIQNNCQEHCKPILDKIDQIYKEGPDPKPFICVGGSSGMGKSQLAFSLGGKGRTHGRPWFYWPLAGSGEVDNQPVYKNFLSIARAFDLVVQQDQLDNGDSDDILACEPSVYQEKKLLTYSAFRPETEFSGSRRAQALEELRNSRPIGRGGENKNPSSRPAPQLQDRHPATLTMTSAPSSPSKTQTPRATAATTLPQRDPAAERVVIDVDAPYAAAPSDPMLGPAAPATSSSASTAPTPPPTDTPLASGASTSSASSSTASTVPPRASSRLAERKRTAADLAEARRQKRRLVLDKEAVAAAAVRADAIPLGPRSSSLPQPSAQQPSGAASSQPSVTPPVELSTASTPALTQPKLPRTPKTRNKPKTPKPSKTKKAKKAVPTTSPLRIPRASVASQVTAHTQPSAAPSPEAAALATSAARAPSPLLSPTIAQPQSSARGAGPISCRATPAPHTQRTRTESPDPPRSAPPPPTDAPDDSDEDIYYHAQPTATTAHAPPRQAAGAVNVDLPSASTSEPYARGGSNTHVPIPATSAFDLSRFLSQFQAGAPDNSTTSASATGTPNTAEYSSAFTALMGEFTRFLHDRQYPAGTAQTAQQLIPMFASVHSDTGSWSLPNHRNELPPVAVRNLRASDFGSPPVRARGDFIPSAVHSLAAHRLYPFLLSPEGRGTTPMAFVLRMRLLESVNFLDAPPILGATHSARFGRFGVTIMHFLRADRAAQLDAGSSDANYSLDFGANVAPPQAPSCRNYHDLLGAIQGLTTFANAEWYEPMAHVLYRLRDFATRNMDEDPDHSPELVKRTLDEVNQFLGSTFIHLSSDSPAWWRDFCASAQRITFTSPSWAIALSTTRRAPAAAIHSSPPARVVSAQRQVTSGGGENPQPRPSAIPQKYRAMIPRNADGQEPCLRFFAGSMCYGGTTATCGSRSRVHSWPEDLPPALIEYIKKRFGRRDTGNRRRS